MNNEEYRNSKHKVYYEDYFLKNKMFKKVRALIVKDNKLCAIKVSYKDGRDTEYLLIGGGVDGDENVRDAVIREAKEELNANIEIVKYLGKKYFNKHTSYQDKKFLSKRVEFFYLCKYLNQNDNKLFGLEGEFDRPDREYSVIELSIEDLKEITYKNIYHMPENIYHRLLQEMEENKEM